MESSLYVYALKNVADADKSELKLVFVFSKRDNLQLPCTSSYTCMEKCNTFSVHLCSHTPLLCCL